MLEEAGQRLHTRLQGRVLGLHLAAEARHHGHGGVERVLVDEVAAVPDEGQDAVQPARLEHGARLPGADQLQHLGKHHVLGRTGIGETGPHVIVDVY